MAHYFHIQAWQMRRLTPWEHDSLVEQTNVQIASLGHGDGIG
jgi:hypothetical protein